MLIECFQIQEVQDHRMTRLRITKLLIKIILRLCYSNQAIIFSRLYKNMDNTKMTGVSNNLKRPGGLFDAQ